MLAEITDEGAVKVEIDSVDSALSSGMYTFAVASDCKTITTIDDTVEFTNNSVLEDVLIEELVIGSLSNNTQINLMLTDSNFKWEYNEGTTVTGSGGFDFSYTLQESDYNENTISFVIEDLDEFSSNAPESRGSITIKGLEINPEAEAEFGNVEMQVSGDEITTETLTFGEYVDYSVSVYADDADSLITHTQGTIGVDVELPTLIIEEDVVNSWLINRNTEIEFPSWIKIKNIVVEDETTNIVNSKGIPFSENDLYWDAGDTSIEIDDLAPASWDVMEMHLTFTVDIDANAPLGEIDVLLSGHALYPDF